MRLRGGRDGLVQLIDQKLSIDQMTVQTNNPFLVFKRKTLPSTSPSSMMKYRGAALATATAATKKARTNY